MLRRSIPVAVAILAISVPNAAAQFRRGVQVAGPTPSGARLFVHDEGRSLCGSVRQPRQRFQSEHCRDGSEDAEDPLIVFDHEGRRRVAFLWGAVPQEVTAVEIVLRSGRRVRTETVEGSAYRGRRAGEVRFFLAETPKRPEPLYLRLLDQAGQLLDAEEVTLDGGSPRGRPVVVDRGRIGSGRWRLSAFLRPRLLPLPGEPERVVDETCLELSGHGGGGLNGPQPTGEMCADPDGDFSPWTVALDTACQGIGLTAFGLAAPDARRLVAVLGDGRRVRIPLRRLGAGFGDQRAFALVLGPRTALRRLLAFQDGRRRSLASGIPPGISNCPNSTTSFGLFGFFGPDFDPFDEPEFGPDGPVLQVRDEGVRLCATIALPGPLDCSRPPVEAEDSRVMWHRTDSGTHVAGVLAEEVAAVALVQEGGERQVVPTTTEGPYTGRYRGRVRFFTVTLSSAPLRRVELLASDGRRLYDRPVFDLEELDAPEFSPVLRGRGGWRVGAGVLRAPGERALCLQLARGAFVSGLRGLLLCGDAGPNIRVSCRPRGMHMYGRLGDGVRTARVETDSGVFQARIARLPARLGGRGRVFLVQLPAAARPQWLVFERGGSDRRQRIRLPAAARQCGYDTDID